MIEVNQQINPSVQKDPKINSAHGQEDFTPIFKYLKPSDIKIITSLSDFETPIENDIPDIRQISDKYYCVGGGLIVSKAISNEVEEIRCLIKSSNEADETELVMIKAHNYLNPPMGELMAAQKTKLIRDLYNFLMSSGKDFKRYSKGGDRKTIKHRGKRLNLSGKCG
ncbi:MAG: hypothetical protein HQK93_01705 [Nitrospirae bacterium]|nr:hypothetical protein [Nitrospirota bacterium]